MSVASNTVTEAATWPAGASVRVADTTIASDTGATCSVSRNGAPAPHGVDAAANPSSEASTRHDGGAVAIRNDPSASVIVRAATVPSLATTCTIARGNGSPDASTTTPVSEAGAAAVKRETNSRPETVNDTRASLRCAHAPLAKDGSSQTRLLNPGGQVSWLADRCA